MTPDGSPTPPAVSLNLRQTIFLIYLLLASITRSSASSQNDDHDGVLPHRVARVEPIPMFGFPGNLLRIRRQSSASAAANGSVNAGTQPPKCSETQFGCQNDKCIPRQFLCDGTQDCPDGSDEKGCRGCRTGEYRCGDGQCIPLKKKCDGHFDCFSGSDERDNCCEANEFQCRNGSCIASAQRCNGNAECSDLSDEYNCNLSAEALSSSGAEAVLTLPAFHVSWILLLALALVVIFTPPCQ